MQRMSPSLRRPVDGVVLALPPKPTMRDAIGEGRQRKFGKPCGITGLKRGLARRTQHIQPAPAQRDDAAANQRRRDQFCEASTKAGKQGLLLASRQHASAKLITMTMDDEIEALRLTGGGMTLVLKPQSFAPPTLVYWGQTADAPIGPPPVVSIARESQPDKPVAASILPTGGFGWPGAEALIVRRARGPMPLSWTANEAWIAEDQTACFTHDDNAAGVTCTVNWAMDAATGVVTATTTVQNTGNDALCLDWLASATLPLPAWASEIIAFPGVWAREQQMTRFAAPPGQWAQENRSGRTGFCGATVLVAAPHTDDFNGPALACHLGWSGDHRLAVESPADGPRMLTAGALSPGEIWLEPGDSWTAPPAYLAMSNQGLNGISNAFHPFARARFPSPLPRRVHYNSWEGVYFALNEAILKALAGQAAALGIERFVLDDGWFEGRRDDTAGLGDWRPDKSLFPEGLGPLIAHVEALGMDFGLWVEPEMVNPQSAAYRAHADQVLHIEGQPQPTMRHQLTWDLSDETVRERLFSDLDRLLKAHSIKALKWDCNRDAFPAARHAAPRRIRQIEGVYTLLRQIRQAHPEVEIEACASGGGRMDLGAAAFTARAWPSDCTDPVERLRIMRWASLVFPLERLGSHVGPSPNPITTRSAPMDFRAKVALFGHMGVELDPRQLKDADRATLTAHIALYKEHRALLHTGRLWQWTTPTGAPARMVVSDDKSEALLLLAQAQMGQDAAVALPGLDDARAYQIHAPAPWPLKAQARLSADSPWRSGFAVTGQALRTQGLRLPLFDPLTAWLVYFKAD